VLRAVSANAITLGAHVAGTRDGCACGGDSFGPWMIGRHNPRLNCQPSATRPTPVPRSAASGGDLWSLAVNVEHPAKRRIPGQRLFRPGGECGASWNRTSDLTLVRAGGDRGVCPGQGVNCGAPLLPVPRPSRAGHCGNGLRRLSVAGARGRPENPVRTARRTRLRKPALAHSRALG
jgi:hypothetical protein